MSASLSRAQLVPIASTGEVRSEAETGQVGLREKIRDSIVARRPRLDEFRPEAVDLAADVLVILHRVLAGSVAALSGERGPDVFQRILRGEQYPLGLEDIARLCIDAPQKMASALALLVAKTGHVVEPTDSLVLSGVETSARITLKTAELVAALTRHLEDGVLEPEEAQQLLPLKASLGKLLHNIDRIAGGTVAQ